MTSNNKPLVFNPWGTAMIVAGVIVTGYFGVIYDTSVPTHYSPDSVHNIGLMQNRTLGVCVGIALTIGGILLGSLAKVEKSNLSLHRRKISTWWVLAAIPGTIIVVFWILFLLSKQN